MTRVRTVKQRVAAFKQGWQLYLMLVPVLLYFIIFHYWPMYGVQIAFKDYLASLGVGGSQWVGLSHFDRFFSSFYAARLIRNTFVISVTTLVFSFPVPVILALLISELKNLHFKKTVQIVTFAPHFLSITVVVGMMNLLCATQTGLINNMLAKIGLDRVAFLTESRYFLPLYILSGIWQQSGWNSVIYIAAIAGVDYSLYEAAYLDGASIWKRILHVTIPCIAPTIIVMLILKMGSLLNVGFEKIWLMQNSLNREGSDVISTYVYRSGLTQSDYSYSAAVNLFSSVINLTLLISVNAISKKVSETSLW